MPSIAQIQHKLKEFDAFARRSDKTAALQKKWAALFDTPLTELSAKSFVAHYRNMRSGRKTKRNQRKSRKASCKASCKVSRKASRKHRGGVAPLNYVMTPGADVPVYGRFPVELDTNPAGIQDLDRYFQDSLTLECGKENISLQVPPNMGSNQVGGRKNKGRQTKRQNNQCGAGLVDWLTGSSTATLDPSANSFSRPYVASVYPNILQRAATTYDASAPNYPAPAAPEDRTWSYSSHGIAGAINPAKL
jgi:hypothetical protein